MVCDQSDCAGGVIVRPPCDDSTERGQHQNQSSRFGNEFNPNDAFLEEAAIS